MSPDTFASLIDHSLLRPEATATQVDEVIADALRYRFAAVCIAPRFVAMTSAKLRGSGIKTCSVISFPHGSDKSILKAIAASSAVKEGADEIDVVAFLPAILSGDFEAIKAELLEIVRAARAAHSSTIIKVIIESALLQAAAGDQFESRIQLACQAVRESGCDFIKTSTGFHPAGGATVEAVHAMKKFAGGIKVKASGGIQDLPAALAMIEAGADRIGTSRGVKLVESLASAIPRENAV